MAHRAVAWEHLVDLCRWPHRAATSANEAEAAEYLAECLRGMGAEVSVEPFPAPRDTLYRGPALVALAVATAAASAWVMSPAIGLVVQLLALAVLVGDASGSAWLDFDLVLPRGVSRNVVARFRSDAASGGRVQGSLPAPVVVMAHYDTQRASWLFAPRVVRHLKAVFGIAYLALAAGPVSVVGRWLVPNASWPAAVALAGGAVLVVFAALLLWGGVAGRHVQGANDNASGVALALALAMRWRERPPGDRPLWVVLTGAEEVGERGAKAFFRRHGGSLDRSRTAVVNLDNLGGRHLRFLTGEGMLQYVPYDDNLLSAARVLALHRAPQRVGPWPNLILPTDGLIAARRGFRAITFVALGPGGAIPDYHWPSDRPERVDREALAFAEDFLWDYLRIVAGERPAQAAQGGNRGIVNPDRGAWPS